MATLKVNAYRLGGKGINEIIVRIKQVASEAVFFKTAWGDRYTLKENPKDHSDYIVLGRIRRLQKADVPPIGDDQGNEEDIAKDKGLAHRAFFLVDQENRVLLWLSSYNTCGPAWLLALLRQVGCRISLATYLDLQAFHKAKAGKDLLTKVSVSIATDYGADLGLPITDELLERAENHESDLVDLTLRVRHQKNEQRTLSNVFGLIEALKKSKESNPRAVKSLKVELFDAQSGEFTALNLIKERKFAEFESDFSVQQLSSASAYDILVSAHEELVPKP